VDKVLDGVTCIRLDASVVTKAWQAAALTAATLGGLAPLARPRREPGPRRAEDAAPHVARRARLARGGRHRLNIQASWPWVTDIVTAWDRISALPQAA
jgi:hypothetical protein